MLRESPPQEKAMRPFAIFAIFAIAIAVSFTSFAEEPKVAGGIAVAPGKAAGAAVVKVSATVEAVDPATRSVTLKGPKGDLHTIVAGDEVRNFDQIKVGDKVTVKYLESLTIELKRTARRWSDGPRRATCSAPRRARSRAASPSTRSPSSPTWSAST